MKSPKNKKKHKNQRKKSSSSSSSSRSRSRTPEKERKQKLATKMALHDQLKQQQIHKQLGYTDTDNPFGDKNLTQQFIWSKNEQKSKKIKNQVEIEQEILEIKKKREEREKERIMMQEEKNKTQKQKENENFQVWLEKEKGLQEDQNRIRGLIRLSYDMEEPIDKLMKIFFIYQGKFPYSMRFEVIMKNPKAFLASLSVEEIYKVQEEAKNQYQLNLERKDGFKEFWDGIISLCSQILDEIENNNDEQQDKMLADKNLGGPEFEEDVQQMFAEKSYQELLEMAKEIDKELQNKEVFGVMDFEYWEQIQKKLKIKLSEVQMTEYFYSFEKNLKQENEANGTNKDVVIQKQNPQLLNVKEPELLEFSEFFDENAITEEQNREILQQRREAIFQDLLEKIIKRLKEKLTVVPGDDTLKNRVAYDTDRLVDEYHVWDPHTVQLMEQERTRPLEAGEQVFDEHIEIPKDADDDQQNFSLKKPQYFNRVKMGYDWNKYNQMHFDEENPPNMIVLGYKFNIFYPEILQKSQTPKYWLEQVPGEPDFAIIRFNAGPPYEDIQFKILNREWELSDKFGFRCVFNRGILHLYFNFKKVQYRK